jgi:hypothetical protein
LCFCAKPTDLRREGATRRGTLTGMEVPTDLQTLGRAFLAALVARHDHPGAAGVLLLLAAELKARQREPPRESG